MRIRSSALLLVAIMCAAMLSAQEETEGGPKLELPEKIKDFGVVPQGDILVADFKVVNRGTVPLEVKSVRPTCGCTVADFDREVAPGGEGWIKAKLNTTGFSGPISKSVLIVTNDPQLPTSTVIIKANVKPYLEVVPRPLVRFSTVQHQSVSQKLTVVSPADEDFRVKAVTSGVPFVTGSVRKLEEQELFPGKHKDQYEIVLTLADDAPVGPVNAEVVVETDHPKASKVQIKVFGVVRAVLHVTPSQIQFGSVEAAVKPGRNVIVVNNRPDASVVVTAAEVDDPAFEARVFSIEEGKRYQVTITVRPEADSGSRDATLILHTTDAQFETLRVPIRANIR